VMFVTIRAVDACPELEWLEFSSGSAPQPENTLSIFRMIRSAHWTAAETKDSVLGLERQSNRSSVVFR